MRMSDWSSDVCSSDRAFPVARRQRLQCARGALGGGRRVAHHAGGLEHRIRIDRSEAAPGERGLVHFDRGAVQLHRAHDRVERQRSEEHTSELQSLMRISYAVFCLKKKKT